MNRRSFLAKAAVLPISGHAAVAASLMATTKDEIHLGTRGYENQPIMNRYRLTLERVLHGTEPRYTPEFLIEDIRATQGRRFTNFSGDVSGRWIGSLATASAAYGEHIPILDDVVQQIIALQHADGYFGSSFHVDAPGDDDMALLWGNGRLLVGLMEYYELAKKSEVLSAARRLGDFLLRIAPKFNSPKMASDFNESHFATSYICWTQQTEGLALLYKATNDKQYLNLAAAISERIERRPGDHVHGYLCSLRGTLDLFSLTGNRHFYEQVEAAWQDVTHSGDLLVTGGVPEAWSPKKLRTEGCAECDWMRLNLALWRASGKEEYLALAEDIIFNEFAMNQFLTGDFGHAVLNEFGTPETLMVRAWWCCTFHGLRAFPEIHQSVFRVRPGEAFYDLPLDGHVSSAGFSAHAESRIAIDGTVRIFITRSPLWQALTLRRPAWAHDMSVSLNGSAFSGLRIPGLKAGDEIIVKYGMNLSCSPSREGRISAGRKTFHYGPWLLGVSSETNPKYFNELQASNVLLSVHARSRQGDADLPFHVPVATATATYRPAEFPEQPAVVELRAIAEQTAYRPARWQMTFIVENK